ncbi:YDG/SRA domain-containing protein [Akkermansiaceae bacterium]|nr:YDG/SRA domain-containing protein [Akkermansiaceae bacterium]
MATFFGHPNRVKAGDLFKDRKTAADSGVHRPLQAGICGTTASGCESIVLSVWEQSEESVEVELPLAEGKKFLRFAMPSED